MASKDSCMHVSDVNQVLLQFRVLARTLQNCLFTSLIKSAPVSLGGRGLHLFD